MPSTGTKWDMHQQGQFFTSSTACFPWRLDLPNRMDLQGIQCITQEVGISPLACSFSHINLIALTSQELRPEDRIPLQNPRRLFG